MSIQSEAAAMRTADLVRLGSGNYIYKGFNVERKSLEQWVVSGVHNGQRVATRVENLAVGCRFVDGLLAGELDNVEEHHA